MFACIRCCFTAVAALAFTAAASTDVRSQGQDAVGFDLSVGYGHSAIRHDNGSFTDGVKVSFVSEYKDMMSRLATSHYYHACDERGVPSRWRQLKCQSIKSQRRLNRLLGQPESKEVKIISEQLSLLQTGTEALLDRTVDRVMVSYPPLRGLWEDDVVDAIRHTGLDHIPFSEDTNTVSSARAAIAANGLGMCDHYTDPLACWDETYHMKWRVVLAIEYTKDTLIVTLTDMKGIHDVTDNFSEVCIECGAESEIKHLDPSFYWPHLRNKILALPTAHRVPVTNVVLYGEAAPDTEFQENLIKALGNVQDERGEPISIGNPNDSQKVLSRRTKNLGLLDSGIHVQIVDPVVAPARGAAELAKRRLDAPTDDRGKKLPI